jgi:hypothetical protein
MAWNTYRATLRRDGCWRQRDLNEELVNPLTRNIAVSWSRVFESDLFTDFDLAVMSSVIKLLEKFEESVPAALKDRASIQVEACKKEARIAVHKTIEVVSEAMNEEQKEISRCLAPHIQNRLKDGYRKAMKEVGPGSFARQKVRSLPFYFEFCGDRN